MNDVLNDDKLFRASVLKIRDLVACTAGPWGKNVQFFNGMPITLRDGLRVMTDYVPNDPMTGNVLIRLRQRAKNVVDRAGDGTTTMTVLTAAIYEEAMKAIEGNEVSRRGVGAGIRAAARQAMDILREMALPVTRDEAGKDLMFKVATIAAGNDPVIGRKVTDLMWELGPNGVVHTEYSESGREIEIEKVQGFTLPGGAYDPSFVANNSRSVTLENPCIVVIRGEVSKWEEIAAMAQAWGQLILPKGPRPLLFCCSNMNHSALSTLIRREHPQTGGKLPWYAVHADVNHVAYLRDLAAVTGAMYFSKNDGGMLLDDFTKAGIEAFGTCEKVTITMRDTVFLGLSPENTARAVADVEAQMLEGMDPEAKNKLQARLSNINGDVGVVKIPLATMGEASFYKEVVDDAYLAARSAARDGVLPGAGRGFIWAAINTVAEFPDGSSNSFAMGWQAATAALYAVTKRLCLNGGVDPSAVTDVFEDRDFDKNDTVIFNDKTLGVLYSVKGEGGNASESDYQNCFGNAVKLGVLDSAAVQIAALDNAATEAAEWVETAIFVMPSVS